jgi:hypothetical protein
MMPAAESLLPPIEAPSKRRIAVAAGVALVVASFIVVAAVLPAEHGIDPFGTGRALGLLDVFNAGSDEPSASPPPAETAAASPRVYRTESTQFTLRPGQAFEYKYRLQKDRAMVYAWTASGNVKSEFHGEPDDSRLKVESYDKQEGDHGAGALTAPFSGIHGWFWENADKHDLTITLVTSGFYSSAEELRPVWDAEKHKNRIDHVPHQLSTPDGFAESP